MLIYLHGFNSSPASRKAQVLARVMADRGLGDHYSCPALPHRPMEAVASAETVMAKTPHGAITFIGSSLGGYYATWLAEKHCLRAVLINPAVHPHRDLRAYLGVQQNLYTGEKYDLTEDHLCAWEDLFVPTVTPSRYLLLVETGDEVLDYREAVDRYAGATQVVVSGGDHTLQGFPEYIPLILDFAGLGTSRQPTDG